MFEVDIVVSCSDEIAEIVDRFLVKPCCLPDKLGVICSSSLDAIILSRNLLMTGRRPMGL